MNREGWTIIKENKSFHVNVYRRGLVSLIVSLGLSCVLGVLMFYVYLTKPERDFYATSGVAPPIKLTPLLAPNMSSQALLPPDPPTDEQEKLIPQ